MVYRSTLRGLGLRYDIRGPDEDPLLYAEVDLPLAQATRFYRDRSKSILCMVLERADPTFWTLSMTYGLRAADGRNIGVLRYPGLVALLFRHVHICDSAGDALAEARRDSSLSSFTRRCLPSGMRDRHDFVITDGIRKLGTLDRDVTLVQRYMLDLSYDTERCVDPRLAVALAVLLAQSSRW